MPAALLGVLSFGLGLGWLQTRRLLDDIGAHSSPAAAGMPHAAADGAGSEPALGLAQHAAFIAFTSGAVGMSALAFSLHARLRCGRCGSGLGRHSW